MGKRYIITSTIEFGYESDHGEFASMEEAEAFAGNYDNLMYYAVDSQDIEEIETCDDCENDLDSCDCEEEEAD